MEIKGTTKKGGGKEEKANLDNGYYHKDKELGLGIFECSNTWLTLGRRVF